MKWSVGRARFHLKLAISVAIYAFVCSISAQLSQDNEEICTDKDIRNNVSNFKKLENCTVIEGFLQISLIDKADSKDYENISFPKLREVTGFFFLYRVAGLKSLRNLFPNLSVIRGTKLFHNFGFIVYEMMALEEISLPSLTNILRGSVRISRNPLLCYVNTIDWDLIAGSGIGGHVIKQNRDSNECPEQCPPELNCPLRRNKQRCWNQKQCQKVCDKECGNRACSTPNECCSDECLGGCDGKGSNECFVCSGVKFRDRCTNRCLPNTFKYADRRCLDEGECMNLTKEVWDGHIQMEVNWKPFKDECRHECPLGYMENSTDLHTCIPCVTHCPKVCNGILVDSVSTAQMLRGCTRIAGSLEIQISGGANIIKELEENLNMIEEVDDYVKIIRSNSLISLSFLKNLKKINGTKKDKIDYSLLVYDNLNLQELFDLKNSNQTLQIVSGKIFFHLNPKLCLAKIKELNDKLGLPGWEERDVSAQTNGDRISCDVNEMKSSIGNYTSKSALVHWENVQRNFSDHRSLLGYVVAHREAPYRNVSTFDGRDACSSDIWKEDLVPASEDEIRDEGYMIFNLKPFTQYAVYIRTYTTVGTENYGAQSKLLYFTTYPDYPSIPIDLKAVSYSPFEMELSWMPPLRPNGNVTEYEIKGFLEKDQHEHFDNRDYCKQHFKTPPHEEQKSPLVNKTDVSKIDLSGKCENTKEKIDFENAAKEAEFENQFEDTIHNHVYIKNDKYENNENDEDDHSREKRSIDKNLSNDHKLSTNKNIYVTSTTIKTVQSTTINPILNDSSVFTTKSTNSKKTIQNLRHFTKYVIEISACHDNHSELGKLCSAKAIVSERTAPLADADNINQTSIKIKVQNETNGAVHIRWAEPVDPNGVIVTFELEYKRTNIKNFKPVLECITHRQYRTVKGYNLTSLSPGSYSLRLRAMSLAGYGNWTLPVYFDIADLSDGLKPAVIAAIAASTVIFLIIIIAFLLWIVFKRRYGKNFSSNMLYASVNPEYLSTGTVYVPDEWEVPREKITILKELGQGSFGMVYSGIANDIVKGQGQVKCAIKTVNENASVRERIEFLNEASVMKAFTSYHVLKLMGVVSKGQPTLVVMELMAVGDLKAFLRSQRPDDEDGQNTNRQPPTLNVILRMASEIADGMAYLAAKKFVHRDLAARNCMVAEDYTVKIGDFGMTRDVYETDYYRKGGKGLLPVRWMAPESLKDGVFTSLSDAWSFGIVLWEMATLASQPYQGLSNEQVLKYVIDGGVMDRPEACPDKLYDLMRRCWNQSPKLRPTFLDLVSILLPYVRPSFVDESFYFSEEAERLVGNTVEDDDPSTPLCAPIETTSGNDELEMKRSGSDPSNHVKTPSDDGGKGLSSGDSNDSKLSSQSLNGGLINGHFYRSNVSSC